MKLTRKVLSDINTISKIASHTAFGEASNENKLDKQQFEGFLQNSIQRIVVRAVNELEKSWSNCIYEDYSQAVVELSKRIGRPWLKAAEN